MSAIRVLKPEQTRDFHVPTITSTTPICDAKEIDLTFVRFAQRKKAANDYIENVAYIKEIKKRKLRKVLNTIGEFLSVISLFASLYMIYIVMALFA